MEHLKFCNDSRSMESGKSCFLQTSVKFLGHMIDADGVHATEDNYQASSGSPKTSRAPLISQFIELLWQVFHEPVHNTSSPQRSVAQGFWMEMVQGVPGQFPACQGVTSVLTHYDPDMPIKMDASAYGIGAVSYRMVRNAQWL